MSDYWEDFWKDHALATRDKNPQLQVLRTLNKEPITDEQFQHILNSIKNNIRLSNEDRVLDLCCGNGLITRSLSTGCRSVVGVDFAEGLISEIDLKAFKNISILVNDVKDVTFQQESFDKIILYAGLQYFSEKETVVIFENAMNWLKTGGLFLIADIPDRNRIWNFFNSKEREKVYYENVKKNNPIVGTWFEEQWLTKLAKYIGFAEAEKLLQPIEFPYAHYRFDFLLKK